MVVVFVVAIDEADLSEFFRIKFNYKNLGDINII